MTEIERKFLLETLPEDWQSLPSARIRQGYVTGPDDATEVRLRDTEGEYTLTVKRGAGSVRDEVEIPLGSEEFHNLWALTADARLEKRRVLVRLGEGADATVAEVDVYWGAHAPLTVVEVEFDSEESRDAFRPPAWFGDEVTGDRRFSNRHLAYRDSSAGTKHTAPADD